MKSCFTMSVLAVALILPVIALSQTVVGRAVVDGKIAFLLDDGTWNYQDGQTGAQDECKDITQQVKFCGQSAKWSEMPPQNPEINAAFRIDARHYAQYLIEDLGTDDGLNSEFVRTFVLGNAASFSGQEPEVIDVQAAKLGEMSGETIVYRTAVNGVNVVYANSIFLGPKRSMQITTFAIASDYSPQHAQLQADFLSFTKVSP